MYFTTAWLGIGCSRANVGGVLWTATPLVTVTACRRAERASHIRTEYEPDPIGVGRANCSPSLRTVRADLPHTALRLVVHPAKD